MSENPNFENRINLTPLHEQFEKVRAEIGRVIVGQHGMVELLLTALLADGHILIEGVPGVAKTMTAKLLARVVDADFSRIQFTPDLMPSDVLGTSVFNARESVFEFRRGPIFSNIVLIDEINRAPAKTQAALFEVMEERQVTVDGKTYPMHEPYVVIATQNPVEHEGTYRLPEAQLDRFLFKINVGYPGVDEETEILNRQHARGRQNAIAEVQRILSSEQIASFRNLAGSVHVETPLMRYAASLVHETRQHPMLFLGASPRASLALLSAGKAFAALQGRDFLTPEDVKFVCLPVMRHRIALNADREMEGLSPDEVLKQIIEKVEVPR